MHAHRCIACVMNVPNLCLSGHLTAGLVVTLRSVKLFGYVRFSLFYSTPSGVQNMKRAALVLNSTPVWSLGYVLRTEILDKTQL